jgi:hypothetical protein
MRPHFTANYLHVNCVNRKTDTDTPVGQGVQRVIIITTEF